MQKNSDQFRYYSKLIHPSRTAFLRSAGINYFMTESNPKNLHSFLLIWTCASIKMTEKVEDWIKRAGEGCQQHNFTEVGARLKYHASQEADHDKMLVEDLNFLVHKWNELYHDNLTAIDLSKISLFPETKFYVDLHEAVINSHYPYAQTAIEFEIERISVVYGPRMIENIINILGDNFSTGISFLEEHVLLDQGHTKFNIDLMEKCLGANADITKLVETGAKALSIYSGFLNSCQNASSQLLERVQWKSHLTI